jgi:hypothetical protein
VTILVLGVLTITILAWLRFYQGIRSESFIVSLSPSVSPAYLVLTGLIFGLAGVPTAQGLWFGKPWAPRAVQQLGIALAVYYWMDFAFFVVSDAARGSWPFAAGVTVLGLAWVFWTLSRPGARAFFENTKN